jgi:hypothetical protein
MSDFVGEMAFYASPVDAERHRHFLNPGAL